MRDIELYRAILGLTPRLDGGQRGTGRRGAARSGAGGSALALERPPPQLGAPQSSPSPARRVRPAAEDGGLKVRLSRAFQCAINHVFRDKSHVPAPCRSRASSLPFGSPGSPV